MTTKMDTNQQCLKELKRQVKELAKQIDRLEEQINNSQPTTGLLGRWAKHPECGNVLVVDDRAISNSLVHVRYLDETLTDGAQDGYVNLDSLTFPEQTTRAQDVPAGEAWLVDAHNGNDHHSNTPALKINR